MRQVKILVASKNQKLTETLKSSFLFWGIDTLEFEKIPDLTLINKVSPHLIFTDLQCYQDSKIHSESQELEFVTKKGLGIVIVVDQTDKMQQMKDVEHINFLKMPYSEKVLFETIRLALKNCNMEYVLDEMLNKLDQIYSIWKHDLSLDKDSNHCHSVNASEIEKHLEKEYYFSWNKIVQS